MTPRDRVWLTVLAIEEDRTGFSARQVYQTTKEAFGDDAPARTTVANTLDAMVEGGYLERLGEPGKPAHFVPR